MTDIAEGVALDQDLETGTTGGATPDHCLDPDLARQGTQEEEASTGGRILDLSHGPDQIHPTRGVLNDPRCIVIPEVGRHLYTCLLYTSDAADE